MTGSGQAEAGQELDARVARAAFKARDSKHLDDFVNARSVSEPAVFSWEVPGRMRAHVCVTAQGIYLTDYRPSTDLNDAMRAAEAVGLLDRYCLWRYMGLYYVGDMECQPAADRALATGETAALAIARAVVAVAEKREGQGEK